ncbi:MAG: NAD(P)H-binding protein [Hyphomonadaceae bacterium]|nr:NAD(P)H-binding protein [Hyphomonadaceae bacterium]
MKIAIIGATGFVGSKIRDEALARDHQVTAIVRKPETLPSHPRLVARALDIQNKMALALALAGHDAIVSAYSPGRGSPIETVYQTFVAAHRSIIDAVKLSGVARYLAVGGAASLKTPEGVEFMESPAAAEFAAFMPALRGTREQYYMLKGEPGLDWVFLAPSVMLAPGERTGKYRTGKDHILYYEPGKSSIALEDYAVAMIDEIERPAHHRERFTVGY